jgi:hypothetical protein
MPSIAGKTFKGVRLTSRMWENKKKGATKKFISNGIHDNAVNKLRNQAPFSLLESNHIEVFPTLSAKQAIMVCSGSIYRSRQPSAFQIRQHLRWTPFQLPSRYLHGLDLPTRGRQPALVDYHIRPTPIRSKHIHFNE